MVRFNNKKTRTFNYKTDNAKVFGKEENTNNNNKLTQQIEKKINANT